MTTKRLRLAELVLLCGALAGGGGGNVFAADAEQSLKRIEEELRSERTLRSTLDQKAEALRRELDQLRDRLVALADEARPQDAELARLESDIRELESREAARADALAGERGRTAALLGALVHLARLPPEAVLARDADPRETLRTILLLRSTIPELDRRAAALAKALADLEETRSRLVTERERLTVARVRIDERRRTIEELVHRRELLSQSTSDERAAAARRMAQLQEKASDLKSLVEQIELERRASPQPRIKPSPPPPEEKVVAQLPTPPRPQPPPPAPSPPAAVPRSEALRLPVGGSVIVKFGQTDRFGAASRGITISAPPRAPVVAPASGTVRFAGPFRGYGLILIVEHGNGYHSLIAGLGRIDSAVGRDVAGGEPIGAMPDPGDGPDDGAPDLYFELRRNGQPTNPQRGFGAAEAKGHG